MKPQTAANPAFASRLQSDALVGRVAPAVAQGELWRGRELEVAGRQMLLTSRKMSKDLFDRIADGRTDLVFDYVAAGHAATSADESGVIFSRRNTAQ